MIYQIKTRMKFPRLSHVREQTNHGRLFRQEICIRLAGYSFEPRDPLAHLPGPAVFRMTIVRSPNETRMISALRLAGARVPE
jgi:hypothetical protein